MRTAPDVNERNGIVESRAVAAIDVALGAATHRAAYTRDEAIAALNDVVLQMEQADHVTPVLAVIERALASMEGQALVDPARVIDVLLDLRLVLAALPTTV